MDLNTPIWQLTVGEFMDLMKPNSKDIKTDGRLFDYGIAGIARTFGCSRSTACRIKESGKYKSAISQVGRKIVIDVNKALEIKSEK